VLPISFFLIWSCYIGCLSPPLFDHLRMMSIIQYLHWVKLTCTCTGVRTLCRSLTVRKGNILRPFQNKVMRRIFGPTRKEEIAGCIKLRNDELHIMYSFLFWLYSPLLRPRRFFSFLILYTVGRTPCTGDQPVARSLPIHKITQTQNKRTQTSMPRVGFEPTTTVFERTKTVYA
jgi:hypothetical protein